MKMWHQATEKVTWLEQPALSLSQRPWRRGGQSEKSDLQGSEAIVTNQLVSNKARRMHSEIETIVLIFQAFSLCENDVILRHMKFEKVFTATLLTYVAILTTRVQLRLGDIFQKSFLWSWMDKHMVRLIKLVYLHIFQIST